MNTLDVFFQLIEREEVVDVIWNLLNAIWEPKDDIAHYYRKGEENINEIERVLNDTFFEIYDVLYKKSNESRMSMKPPLIIMDGFSIREGNLMEKILKEKGFKISNHKYTFSCFPSVTEEFCRRVFNASNASAIKGDFRYERVLYGKVPFNSLSEEKTVIWINYPDYLLHHAGKILSPEESFERTSKTLLEVLERFETDKVTITSDHGYIFLNRVWPVSPADARFLRSIFKAERFVSVSDVENAKAEQLRKVPKELSWVLECNSRFLIKGRYAYPTGGGRIVTHGGVSLMESMVPSIEVEL